MGARSLLGWVLCRHGMKGQSWMQKSLSRQKIQMVGQKENTWQVLQQCCCIRGTIFQEILDWCCPKAADGRQGEALLPVTSRNAVRKTPLRANTTWKRHQCADQQLLSWAGLCAESRNAARSCCLSLSATAPECTDIPGTSSRLLALCLLPAIHTTPCQPAQRGICLRLEQK